MADMTITVRENGPYLASGPIHIVDAGGNEFGVERELVALCRCGGSQNKPFCDGTHARIGFAGVTRAVQAAEEHTPERPWPALRTPRQLPSAQDTDRPNREQRSGAVDQPSRTYENERVAVAWYSERCLHTARCIMGLPDVFDPRRRPWIVLDGHTADEIAEVVQRCPTGALHFRRLDGGPQEAVPDEPIISPVPDGPLYVRGDVVVEDEAGGVFREDTRMALCRCGQSRHKPFCDNTHRLIGFRAR